MGVGVSARVLAHLARVGSTAAVEGALREAVKAARQPCPPGGPCPPPTHSHPPPWLACARRALKGLLGATPPSACGLVLTEPYLNLPALREAAVRLALDDLGFGSVVLSTPAPLALRWHAAAAPGLPANLAGCGLVLDAGFSFTHAVRGPGSGLGGVVGPVGGAGAWQGCARKATLERCCARKGQPFTAAPPRCPAPTHVPAAGASV